VDQGFLAGGGMRARIRAHDWAATPLGPIETWPPSLRTILGLVLETRFPALLLWGAELTCFYNDDYRPMLGAKPEALGRPFNEVWSEAWDIVRPIVKRACEGEASRFESMPFTLMRRGYPDAAYFDFCFSAVRDEAGAIVGVLNTAVETTGRVLAGQRRHAFLLALADQMQSLTEPRAIMAAAVEALGRHLCASRVGYGQVQPDDETIVLETSYADGVKPLTGTFPLNSFGAQNIARQRQGLTVLCDDVTADPSHNPATWAAIETHSFVSVPLVRDGRFRAALYINQHDARAWSPEDVALVEDVAARIWDAVERARAEERLGASEARFRAAVDAVQGVLWTNNAAGEMEDEQPGWAALTGQSYEEYQGYGWAAAVHPEDAQPTIDAWNAAVDERRTFVFEHRVRRHDGAWRIFSIRAIPMCGADGTIREWVGVHTDVTEQRAAEHRLRDLNDTLEQQVAERTKGLIARQAELRMIYDHSSEYHALMTALPDGSFVYEAANPAVLRLYDRTREQVVGHSTEEVLGRTKAVEVNRHLAECLRTTGSYRYERTQNGSIVEAICSAVPTEKGELPRLVVTARDVTDSRRLEERLRQSQKMEAVGQLTGGIAHDFNNLLTGIAGGLELLQARMAQGRINDLERYITAAQGASKRAAALTHRLLAFSRRQTLDPKPTNVNRLVVGMEDLIRRSVGPEVTVEVVAAGGLWTTLVDPNQLENALLNLCINARDAMPDGGRLTIETSNKWLDKRAARERELPPGQYVSLCVSDTGTGMTPEVTRRAFDPFFTTKPIGMGTGLGLSMVYGFIQQSGGQARIYSEPDQGAMVCLYLPRHLAEAQSADEPAELAGAPRAEQGETVLVVDDEPTVRMLVTEVLEDLDYTAIEAVDGATGLQVLQSNARIDLLVTDVGLPGGMNGRQVADAGRTVRPDLKVLFITGYAENAVLSHGHLDPGMHVLTKPFAMEVLASRIRDLIAGT
jgi:PAS domain S-box-containing protein